MENMARSALTQPKHTLSVSGFLAVGERGFEAVVPKKGKKEKRKVVRTVPRRQS